MNFFGPVFYYDLIRTSRKIRYYFLRFIYAVILMALLYLFYETLVSNRATVRASGSLFSSEMNRESMLQFAEVFFAFFMVIQFIVVLILTPAYTASAIAEEKERRTLEFLLATDLRSREIVFGKLASRIGNIFMFLLAGLPILALVQFFGGIDPNLLLVGFLMLIITVVSLASVSILCSVNAKRSRSAITASYIWLFLYFLIGIKFYILFEYVIFVKSPPKPFVTTTTMTVGGPVVVPAVPEEVPNFFDPKSVGTAAEYYLSGNVFHAMYLYVNGALSMRWTASASWTGIDLGNKPWELLRNYGIFHGIVIFFCLFLSLTRLRKVFLHQTYGGNKSRFFASREKRLDRLASKRRWKLGTWSPMIWKEVLVPNSQRVGAGKRFLQLAMIALCLLPFGFIVYEFLFSRRVHSYTDWQDFCSGYVFIVGTILACILVMGTAVRSSLTIPQEREKETLETLISTSLTDKEILLGKWFGGFINLNLVMFLLVLVWSIGLIFGAMHIGSLLLLMLVTTIYCAFAASLGLFFGSVAKSTTRAIGNTLFWLFFWAGGHWLVVVLTWIIFGSGDGMGKFAMGNTPPIVLGMLSYRPDASSRGGRGSFDTDMTSSIFLGVALSALLALILFLWGGYRFYTSSGRVHTVSDVPPIPPAQN